MPIEGEQEDTLLKAVFTKSGAAFANTPARITAIVPAEVMPTTERDQENQRVEQTQCYHAHVDYHHDAHSVHLFVEVVDPF